MYKKVNTFVKQATVVFMAKIWQNLMLVSSLGASSGTGSRSRDYFGFREVCSQVNPLESAVFCTRCSIYLKFSILNIF